MATFAIKSSASQPLPKTAIVSFVPLASRLINFRRSSGDVNGRCGFDIARFLSLWWCGTDDADADDSVGTMVGRYSYVRDCAFSSIKYDGIGAPRQPVAISIACRYWRTDSLPFSGFGGDDVCLDWKLVRVPTTTHSLPTGSNSVTRDDE